MKPYFSVELRVDGKLVKTSKVFSLTKHLISEVHDFSSTLEEYPDGSFCEVYLYYNGYFNGDNAFFKKKTYAQNFCELITRIYYFCDFDVYVGE